MCLSLFLPLPPSLFLHVQKRPSTPHRPRGAKVLVVGILQGSRQQRHLRTEERAPAGLDLHRSRHRPRGPGRWGIRTKRRVGEKRTKRSTSLQNLPHQPQLTTSIYQPLPEQQSSKSPLPAFHPLPPFISPTFGWDTCGSSTAPQRLSGRVADDQGAQPYPAT